MKRERDRESKRAKEGLGGQGREEGRRGERETEAKDGRWSRRVARGFVDDYTARVCG